MVLKLKKIKEVAEYFGFECEIKKNLKPKDLIPYIDENIPVIILVQAYRDYTNLTDYKDDYKDGHYVVCIGYDGEKLIFEDPSSFCRTYLTFDELSDRWHAVDDNQKKSKDSISIIIKGVPAFKKDLLIHME